MSLSVDIKKRLGSFKLDVSFQADAEVMALLGTSGCGKSMTLKCIAGIERPDEGRIVLNGRTLFDSEKHIDLSPQKRRVGYLFQQYALFPNMTVRQNVAAGARGRKDAKQAVEEKIRAMRLQGLENKRPYQLSGGQQQRVALARILVSEPEILLLDEPFSALDSYLRWELEMELSATLKAFGSTALFVSHSREEVYRLCENVCVISNGHSEDKGPVKELMEHPETVSSCILSGCKNISRIEKTGPDRVRALDWGVELHTGPVSREHTHIGVKSRGITPAGGEAENIIPCRIRMVVEDETEDMIQLSTPGGSDAYSRLLMASDKGTVTGVSAGDEFPVCAAPENIMLLRER